MNVLIRVERRDSRKFETEGLSRTLRWTMSISYRVSRWSLTKPIGISTTFRYSPGQAVEHRARPKGLSRALSHPGARFARRGRSSLRNRTFVPLPEPSLPPEICTARRCGNRAGCGPKRDENDSSSGASPPWIPFRPAVDKSGLFTPARYEGNRRADRTGLARGLSSIALTGRLPVVRELEKGDMAKKASRSTPDASGLLDPLSLGKGGSIGMRRGSGSGLPISPARRAACSSVMAARGEPPPMAR